MESVLGAAAAGSVNPAAPTCTAHLHCAPTAVAAASDLVISTLNHSMDSWDQAPAASIIELVAAEILSSITYPNRKKADTLFTGGATESTLVSMLAARESFSQSPVLVCGDNAHHSVTRAAWMLGFEKPVVIPTTDGRLTGNAVADVLRSVSGPAVVNATAGTTNFGAIDELPEIASAAREVGAWLHLDAAYGGALLFSGTHQHRLYGHELFDSTAFDLHKLGWQPIGSGLASFADRETVKPLHLTADYLNAVDDTEHGVPDMLGRSIRTSRRADAVRVLTCLAETGRDGLGELVDTCVDTANQFHTLVGDDERFDVAGTGPGITTVAFRPHRSESTPSEDHSRRVAELRRRLAADGSVILGRAAPPSSPRGDCWLKATVLNPLTTRAQLSALLDTVAEAWARLPGEL
ncbi:pyridoxal phosphate-dependent decarboxylase family protein [Corynebacterium sp. TAE3-ERU16]|uniref:pyridoxal phosphate-dependent decarboxylase family protein n=1 Tax=Corynebacterium sp. TAE3-ERU16 TaxID=2849493 RepID=UPI0021047EF2|nr:aminotransferase class V-fold PLP-dependent enzyme [Corynebacterium sp. TAE3-ERU16]